VRLHLRHFPLHHPESRRRPLDGHRRDGRHGPGTGGRDHDRRSRHPRQPRYRGDAAMSNRPAYIHHVNFPTTEPERTIQWYSQVFGMKNIKPKSNTRVVLMTRGNFDLHFTPVEEMDRMSPYHFAVEVEDWPGFLAHLHELGIRHTRPIQ